MHQNLNMMLDRDLKLEALSAIMGCPVKSRKDFAKYNTGQLQMFQQCSHGQLQKTGQSEPNLLQLCNLIDIIPSEPSIPMLKAGMVSYAVSYTTTQASAIRKELFVNEEDFFDPPYDYDYTHIMDGAREFKRGGERYSRPCGWNRISLKVLGKYTDGDGWLERTASAWPVSYHGTSDKAADGIIKGHYKAGEGKVYGRGIYSTPDINAALGYSKTFTSKKTKKTYNVILQNRINPEKRKKCARDDYWLVPVPEGTSADEEKQISEDSIRPYGLLLREVKNTANLYSWPN